MEKPFSQSCENNKRPILEALRTHLDGLTDVLEIGSGTGQHAVFFGAQMPEVVWQTSDLPDNHAGIRAWIDEAGLANVLPPLALDVMREPWPLDRADAVFSANTAHIMHWPAVQAMLRGVGVRLAAGGLFLLYGPFNEGGDYTSDSNRDFDAWLAARDSESGIRDLEAVDAEARAAGLARIAFHPMPANNRLGVWRKQA